MSNSILLDSNLIIYSGLAKNHNLRQWLKGKIVNISAISKVEVLGYHKLISKDRRYFEAIFSKCNVIPIVDAQIDLAIQLRQQKSMSLGDSLIAATAILQRIPLATANTNDFKHLPELELVNPLAN